MAMPATLLTYALVMVIMVIIIGKIFWTKYTLWNEIKCVLGIKESNFNEKMDQNFHISFWSGPMGLTPFLTVSPTVKYPFFMTSLMTRKSFPMGPSNSQTKTKIFRRDVGLTSIQFHHIFLFPCWQSVLITTSLTIFVNHNKMTARFRDRVCFLSPLYFCPPQHLDRWLTISRLMR